jgi:hypothetical protein
MGDGAASGEHGAELLRSRVVEDAAASDRRPRLAVVSFR